MASDPDLCANCGNQFPAGQVCGTCRRRAAQGALAPDYYNGAGGMQPFDVIDAFGLDFYEGCVIKYIVRWRKKGGVEDLRKAQVYIGELIRRAEAGGAGQDLRGASLAGDRG